jgi:hypothetical protein
VQDVDTLLREALGKKSAAEVWSHLAPLRARLPEREVALAWMTLAQASPRGPRMSEDARAVLAAHGGDEEVVVATLTALTRRADVAGLDAPVDGASELKEGVRLGRVLLAGAPRHRAALSAALGNALARLGDGEESMELLGAAVQLDPEGPWLKDVVLAHKRARRFRAALVPARNAVKRWPGEPGPKIELALAALGAGEPAEAAEALRGLGLTVQHEDGALPLVGDLPPLAVRVPVRPAPHGLFGETGAGFETLWVQPLSPVHGVVRSATVGEAVTDFGDVVLFDVARLGMVRRPDGEGSAPLVSFLLVLKAGDERRLPFLALEQSAGQVEAMLAGLPEGMEPIVFGTRIERVCPRCLAGETLVKHEHLPAEEQRFVLGKLIASAQVPLEGVAEALAARKGPGVLFAIPALYEALGRTAEAGKHHKSWGAISRGLGARVA